MILEIVYSVVTFPLVLVGGLIWIVGTVTGIGPLFQYCYDCADNSFMKAFIADQDIKFVQIPFVKPVSLEYKLAFRLTKSSSSGFPVCIVGDINSGLVSVASIHDSLAIAGFTVLSYDRSFVGLTRPSSSDSANTKTIVHELDYLLHHIESTFVANHDRRWVLLGVGMGSLICQAFIASHPTRVGGYVSLNGLTSDMLHGESGMNRDINLRRAAIWTGILARLHWTGLARVLRLCATPLPAPTRKTQKFTERYIRSYIVSRAGMIAFGQEISLLRDLCRHVSEQWARHSLSTLQDTVLLRALSQSEPSDLVIVGQEHAEVEEQFNWGDELSAQLAVDRLRDGRLLDAMGHPVLEIESIRAELETPRGDTAEDIPNLEIYGDGEKDHNGESLLLAVVATGGSRSKGAGRTVAREHGDWVYSYDQVDGDIQVTAEGDCDSSCEEEVRLGSTSSAIFTGRNASRHSSEISECGVDVCSSSSLFEKWHKDLVVRVVSSLHLPSTGRKQDVIPPQHCVISSLPLSPEPLSSARALHVLIGAGRSAEARLSSNGAHIGILHTGLDTPYPSHPRIQVPPVPMQLIQSLGVMGGYPSELVRQVLVEQVMGCSDSLRASENQ